MAQPNVIIGRKRGGPQAPEPTPIAVGEPQPYTGLGPAAEAPPTPEDLPTTRAPRGVPSSGRLREGTAPFQPRLNAIYAKGLLAGNPYNKGTREFYEYIWNLPYPRGWTQAEIEYRRVIDPIRNEAYQFLYTGRTETTEDQLAHVKATQGTPIIQGIDMSASEIIGRSGVTEGPIDLLVRDENGNIIGDPTMGGDAWLNQFIDGTEVELGANETSQRTMAQALARSDGYVFIDVVADPLGGDGYERSLYVTKTQAIAGITNFTEDEIREYQRRLGLPETGLVDQALLSIWTEAVDTSQVYSANGKEVELKFIFDTLVSSIEAEGGLGGGGGGGGRDLTEDDYYMYMMDVTGDISGVEG